MRGMRDRATLSNGVVVCASASQHIVGATKSSRSPAAILGRPQAMRPPAELGSDTGRRARPCRDQLTSAMAPDRTHLTEPDVLAPWPGGQAHASTPAIGDLALRRLRGITESDPASNREGAHRRRY